jgi:hypothetical protein
VPAQEPPKILAVEFGEPTKEETERRTPLGYGVLSLWSL